MIETMKNDITFVYDIAGTPTNVVGTYTIAISNVYVTTNTL